MLHMFYGNQQHSISDPKEKTEINKRFRFHYRQTRRKVSLPEVFSLKTIQLIGTEGTRLLREKRVQGRPRRRKGAEGGPPAESECL